MDLDDCFRVQVSLSHGAIPFKLDHSVLAAARGNISQVDCLKNVSVLSFSAKTNQFSDLEKRINLWTEDTSSKSCKETVDTEPEL